MDNTELILLIQRILREFPRHRDIIALCEACEALALAKPVKTPVEPGRDSEELSAEEESQTSPRRSHLAKTGRPIRLPDSPRRSLRRSRVVFPWGHGTCLLNK